MDKPLICGPISTQNTLVLKSQTSRAKNQENEPNKSISQTQVKEGDFYTRGQVRCTEVHANYVLPWAAPLSTMVNQATMHTPALVSMEEM